MAKKKAKAKAKAKVKEERITVLDKVREALAGSRKRNFRQSWDLSINLKGLDLKKPENRLNTEFTFPEGTGKQLKVAVFADTLAAEARECADLVITKAEIPVLAADRKKLKRLANEYDWFLGEATVMPLIGKALGPVLGPRDRMPKPIPPKAKVLSFVEKARKSVKITVKESPAIHLRIGTEDMEPENVAANIEGVINFVGEKLPKGKNNIKSAHIKLTMGKPVKITV
ncbi:MAG: 50S ribosomal protein L1 [Candidatus Aenigmarchaeota archaeon]|nr:50S ribosomal protein L1 [Candidatus Aenigmarchaeota archaeon]